MGEQLLRLYIWQQVARSELRSRMPGGEAGEGVISTAIAVLIMAFLGALMWVGFKATLGNTQGNVDSQINQIGR